jgi:light-regulated signal transduction histidine kinase (bacteriophytochrome)
MESYEQHVPVLEFLYRKSGVNIPGFSEVPEILEDPIRDVCNDHERSQIQQMYEQIASLQSQNKELEAYASTVAHDLRDPLYAILLTSNRITNTPDLTHAELKNYLRRITTTVHQMSTIIDNLLLFAKVSNTEALFERVDMGWAVANVLDR